MNALPRFPHPADMPSVCKNINAPDYDDPAYGYEEADATIAASYVENDEVTVIVSEIRHAAGLLDWIAHNAGVPNHLLDSFRELDRRARSFSKRADELIEANA